MGLIYKEVKRLNRSMYLYYPEIERHNPFLVTQCVILRGQDTEASVQELLDTGLQAWAEAHRMVLVFPNPLAGGWNAALDPTKADDLTALDGLFNEVGKEDDEPLKLNEMGIPLLSEMLRQWHLMETYRYIIGMPGGADMAYTYAACRPQRVAAVLNFGGVLQEEAQQTAVPGPVTILHVGSRNETANYFAERNGCCGEDEVDDVLIYSHALTPWTYVKILPNQSLNADILEKVYAEDFSRLRKINTGAFGDMNYYTPLEGPEFTWYLEDESLGDGPHTWLVHIPADLRPDEKVPLVMFYHGGSDNPTEAANMAKLHELGRQERFITVYPWGTNRAGWNINYDSTPGDEDGMADERYGVKLIDWMIDHYPVDKERVYLSGFSNGAAMAQVIAMLYPEKIAGLFHIDSNWPGNRFAITELDINDVPAMRRALEQKNPAMRMPTWYTYGSREASCPAYRGTTQQYQYDFWKQFNNIEIVPTQEKSCENPCDSGVPGQVVEIWNPDPRYPHISYTVNRFYTQDTEPQNYYNYVLVHDKGHEVAPMDAVLGWEFVKQFKRNADGSVGTV